MKGIKFAAAFFGGIVASVVLGTVAAVAQARKAELAAHMQPVRIDMSLHPAYQFYGDEHEKLMHGLRAMFPDECDVAERECLVEHADGTSPVDLALSLLERLHSQRAGSKPAEPTDSIKH